MVLLDLLDIYVHRLNNTDVCFENCQRGNINDE